MRHSTLSVKVVDARREPARFADVAVWIDGVSLSGAALRFASGTAAVTDVNGYWASGDLPETTLEIVATRRSQAQPLRALARRVEVPWQPEVVLGVVE
jgi:hypothetical protein